jgi:hypothetical protein
MSGSTLTTNKNFLSPIGFRLTIDVTKYANVEYFITNISTPDVSIGEIQTTYRNSKGYLPGTNIQFGSLEVSFKVDEDMKNYQELFNWIEGNRSSNTKNDIILHIANSSNNISNKIRYTSAFPTNLSSLSFDLQASNVEYLSASASFRFDHMEFL